MNNKIYWLTGLFFLLFLFPSQAQIDTSYLSKDFLKDYVPPNYKYHRLFIRPEIRESLRRSDNFDRNYLTGSLYGSYIMAEQTDNSDTEMYSILDTDFSSDKQNEVQVDNSNFFSTTLRGNIDKYFYLNSQAFISVGADIYSNNRFLYLSDNLNRFDQNIALPISIGFGRPFIINDAWQAMNIFNDLECYGIAADRSKTKEVADFISAQRNTLFLDNRLGRIQNRAALLNFLNDNDIVNLSALSAAVLHDTYNFESFYTRRSGFRIRGGIIPRLSNFSFGDGSAEPVRDSEVALDPFFNLVYYLPISEDWQLDIYSYSTYESQAFSEQNAFKTTNHITLSWLPNFRNRASVQLYYIATNNELSLSTSSLQLNLSYEYYLSPAVRWNASLYVSQNWQDLFGVKSQFLDQAFSMGFSYRLI